MKLQLQHTARTALPILVLAIFSFFTSKAAHIIGGEMSYVSTAPGEFDLSLILYRDCLYGGANFDSDGPNATVGTVTVYQGSQIFSQYSSVILSAPIVTAIEAEDFDCSPFEICVEKGVYNFSLTLPSSTMPYTVVYQRCCRNAGASNIDEAGTSGITVQTQILPAAHAQQNDSPQFDVEAAIAICANTNYTFDYSCSDNDGLATTYRYSLCQPFVGGGIGGANGDPVAAAAPDGVAPDPDAGPPYLGIGYLSLYSYFNPLGTTSTFKIDSVTGQLDVYGIAAGTFVYGICTDEYFNGELMAQTRRDLQLVVYNSVDVNDVEDASSTNIWYDMHNAQIQISTSLESQKLKLQIFTIDGKSVHEAVFDSAQGFVDVRNWSKGIYQVLITDNQDFLVHQKVVIN